MTHIEQAIKEAVTYGLDAGPHVHARFPAGQHDIRESEVFLDPSFWQALGKARGWAPETEEKQWLYYWHRFIDHLAEGKDLESFFADLI
jgi:hypothetical protein